ncbi:MAG: hypothetical protein HY701_14795 [Gemmatimonadetes bacterium]|nr:hypothetical protein [Gemmatimonadota bacterium]
MLAIRRIPPQSGVQFVRVLAALLLLATSAQAQETSASNSDALPPSDRPAPVTRSAVRTGDVRIDGTIDEPAWHVAPVASGFVQSEPVEDVAASRDTEVRMLTDDEAIYVAARMWDEPESIQRQLVRRDERGPFMDWFGVSLDPHHDQRTGYAFRVNAAGVQQDIYMYNDSGEDMAWNAVWESAVATDSLGWTVEIRIPFSQIRFESGEAPQSWGVNFHRRRVATAELSHFSLESRRRSGRVSQFGMLENVTVPSSVHRVEARPYVVSSFHQGPAEAGDPFFDGSALGGRVGSDFRLGLGTSFTLDGTVNPDFGQVEADPAVINLTAFETFFDERRPFFVEDAQIFDFSLSGGQNQLFYTRRIGRSPQGDAPAGADFVDLPDATTILGAAKLTGRTSTGLSIGALAAVTDAEQGDAFFLDEGRSVTFRAEPRTQYGVVTAYQDLNGGASQVGALATVLQRDLPADGDLDFLPDQAYSAGVRFEHQWSERTWRLHGFLAGSQVQGNPEALVAIQRASNHYFQRPDATRAHVDSSATSLGGVEWRLQLERQNTEHWIGAIWLAEVTRGFEINDLGFSGTRERLDGGFRAEYREIQPGRIFRDYSFSFNTFYNFSHEALDDVGSWRSWRRAYVAGTFNLGSRFTLLNYNGGDVNLSWQPDLYSRSATRGGPVMIQPGSLGIRMGLHSDRRRPTSFNVGFNVSRSSRDSGNEVSVNAGVNLRPSSQLQLQIQPRFSVESDGSQYVTSTATLPYQPTFGRRYFFGDLERKTLSLETRLNYTVSPTLSFQLYAQPLLASGDYVRYKQLAAAGTYEFRSFEEGRGVNDGGSVVCAGGTICRDAQGTQRVDLDGDGQPDYTFRDQDFNVRSLVGNAVLRWEYRPGSTIFLVWQRRQQGNASAGDFDFGRDLDALWAAPADNRFIIKVNYWLGL